MPDPKHSLCVWSAQETTSEKSTESPKRTVKKSWTSMLWMEKIEQSWKQNTVVEDFFMDTAKDNMKLKAP